MLFEHRDTEDRGRSLVCGATPIKPGDVVLTEAPTAYVEMSDNDAVVRKNTFTFASVFAFLRFQKMETVLANSNDTTQEGSHPSLCVN